MHHRADSPRRAATRALTLFAVAAVLLAGCSDVPSPNLAPGDDLVVGRNEDGHLEIRWTGIANGASFEIYVGASPEDLGQGQPLATLSADTPERKVVLPGLAPGMRHYFVLKDRASGETRRVAERLLPLEGAHNFRDLGGYPTRDGRRVRWGKLYRSDHLGNLTDADLEYVRALGIRLVCDFRGPEERIDNPDRLPTPGPTVVQLAIADESFSPSELKRRLLSGDLDNIDQLLVIANRKFATEYRDRYKALFERLAQPESIPTLVHCTAGKDRAGFASAITLLALGVPEEIVFEDYLRTNLYTHEHVEDMLFKLRVASLSRTHPDEARPLLVARREYLQAALQAIRSEYGSVDRYIRDELGVSDESLNELRERLLE